MPYAVEIRRSSGCGLIALRADADARQALAVSGVELPARANTVHIAGPLIALCLGPTEWLLQVPTEQTPSCVARLNEALRDRFAGVAIVSDAYAVFEIAGEGAPDVLAQGTAVDLDRELAHPGQCTRTAFARTVAIIRPTRSSVFELLVPRSHERYVSAWLEAACRPSPPASARPGHA